jgi:hypothetical protein
MATCVPVPTRTVAATTARPARRLAALKSMPVISVHMLLLPRTRSACRNEVRFIRGGVKA